MSYTLITNPHQIRDYEIPHIESDFASLTKKRLASLAPNGQTVDSLRRHLAAGRYLLLNGQPSVPLFLKKVSGSQAWLLNITADKQLLSHLQHIDYVTETDDKLCLTGKGGGLGQSDSLQAAVETSYGDDTPLTVSQRLAKQQQGEPSPPSNQIRARFHYRTSQGKTEKYGNWSGEHTFLADVPWRLIQNNKMIAQGVTDSSGCLLVEELEPATYLLQYGLPDTQSYLKQRPMKIDTYEHIKLESLVLQHYYDDLEHTPVQKVPFQITLKNGTTQEGITDEKGAAILGPFLYKVEGIEFYHNEEATALYEKLSQLNQSLSEKIQDYAKAAAEEITQQYAPSHSQDRPNADLLEDVPERLNEEQVKADFYQAVEDKINELKQQAAEYDAQTWYEKTWDMVTAIGEGMADGVTEYLPDLGEFGDLLDKMGMDVSPIAVIKALVVGDVDELEKAFQQWQARAGEGYQEASEQMAIMIMLLKDPHVRETLLSLPQRFLEAAPTDALVEMGMAQGTQMGVDYAAVLGATAGGTMISGPGGAVTGTLAVSAVTGRKAAKVAEGIGDVLMETSETLAKARNKRRESVNTHAHQSETPSQGKEVKEQPDNCAWHGCTTKHNKIPHYDNRGRTTSKGSNYREKWQQADLEPWKQSGGEGLPTLFYNPNHPAWLLGYSRNKLTDSARKKVLESIANPQANQAYPVQAHHLIPVSLFGILKDLAHNARLVNWNVNDPKHGIFLPVLAPDTLRHGLQMHRGKHGIYTEKVKARLKKIEDQCKHYCATGRQKKLIEELNDLSEDLKDFIIDWDEDYLLRTDAMEIKEKLQQMRKEAEV